MSRKIYVLTVDMRSSRSGDGCSAGAARNVSLGCWVGCGSADDLISSHHPLATLDEVINLRTSAAAATCHQICATASV